MMEDEDKYGRATSFARKTSRPQLMRALSDFEGKTVRRRYVCLFLFILVTVMASIVIYGIVHAASHSGPDNNSTSTHEESHGTQNHTIEFTTVADVEHHSESAKEDIDGSETSHTDPVPHEEHVSHTEANAHTTLSETNTTIPTTTPTTLADAINNTTDVESLSESTT